MPSRTSKIRAMELPADSRLHGFVQPGDFLDCYGVSATMPCRAAANIIVTFPGWVRALMRLRRIVTTPFGLDNDGPPGPDKLGPFPVECESEHEVIAGFNDRHLDFRVSIFSRAGLVSLATWVHAHNLGGRIYLAMIMPFHVMVVRNAVARVAAAGQTS